MIDKCLTVAQLKTHDWDQWVSIPLEPHHVEQLPKYKGNRDKVWNFGTSKEEFKENIHRIAYKYAPHIGGVILEKDHIEADDIALFVVSKHPDAEHILITNDGDWQQLALIGDVKFYNPTAHTFTNKKREQYQYDFYCKLIGGDTSDNIPGAFLLNPKAKGKQAKEKKYAEKSAKNLVDELGLDAVMPYIKENMTPSMRRNITLISMKQGYRHLVNSGFYFDDIMNEIAHKIVGVTELELNDFHTSGTALNMEGAQARMDRGKYAEGLEF